MRLLCLALVASAAASFDCSFASTYPPQYVAYRVAEGAVVVDGRLDEPAWTEVGWSQPFGDIATNATPPLRTQVKLRFDSQFLYVAAFLEEPHVYASILQTCHCVDDAADQVIFHGPDFEVFVDADGSNTGYKEIEVNAATAAWSLLLDKPYDDGGVENSSRVLRTEFWDPLKPWGAGLVGAFTDGVLNQPDSKPSFWSVELALPLSSLVERTAAGLPPAGFWRINFSRVQYGSIIDGAVYKQFSKCLTCLPPGAPVEDNWSWAPQGAVAMHRPERWGILQWSDAPVNTTPPHFYAQWPIREVAMATYWAQRHFAAKHNGSHAGTVKELLPFASTPSALDGTCGSVRITLAPDALAYNATVLRDGLLATVRNDRLLRITAAPRSLPATVLAGYATSCDDKVVNALQGGVNVLIWAFQRFSPPLSGAGLPELSCIARLMRLHGRAVSHLVSTGGWNGAHPSGWPSGNAAFADWAAWNSLFAAEHNVSGFDGVDWDQEGADDPASTNALSYDTLRFVGSFSRAAKQAGFLVTMAPAESYLDPQTNGFSRSLALPYDDGWKPGFLYHGRNGYALWLARYGTTKLPDGHRVPTFDLVTVQLYESYSHAAHAMHVLNVSAADYLATWVAQLAAGWEVAFDDDPGLGLPSQTVSVAPSTLLIGLANGWAGGVDGKVLLLSASQLAETWKRLAAEGRSPRGAAFWVIGEEGRVPDGLSEPLFLAPALAKVLGL